jgi:TRAP-type C4-dicarboxylate transport system permease small subunit
MTGDAKHGPGGEDSDTDLARQLDEATRAADLVDADEGLGFIDRTINRIAEVAGVSVLVVVVLLVFGNAASRYTLNRTAVWADELIISLIPWLAMWGMFLSVRRRKVIRIDFFVSKLPPRVQLAVAALADLVSAAAFAYLAIISFNYVQLFGGDRTVYLKIASSWFISAMTIGAALTALAFLADIVRSYRRPA